MPLLPLSDVDAEAFAKSAYRAYGEVTDFKNYQGLPMPEWQDLPLKIRSAWRAAIQDVAANLFDPQT